MNKIEKIKSLTEELLRYCHEYYDLDSPTISDAEYDKKYDELFFESYLFVTGLNSKNLLIIELMSSISLEYIFLVLESIHK